MASCDWQKHHTSTETKAMLMHCDSVERLAHEHTNKHIDKSRTYLNLNFGEFDKSYADACRFYDERLAELDAVQGANKRKDRVTCVSLNIPAPKGMDEDAARAWFIEAYRIVCDMLKDDNVIGGVAHLDEIHEYTDAETKQKRTSMAHLHVYAIPEASGKLNAKAVCSRANMMRMNNNLEAMTQARFPSYRFLDGTKRKSKKSVEALKAESDVAEIVAEAEREASKIIENARERADRLDAEAADARWHAERYAEELKRDASNDRENAREMLEDAQNVAEGVLSDAMKEAEDIKANAQKDAQRASERITAWQDEVVKAYSDVLALEQTVRRMRNEYLNEPDETHAEQRMTEYMQNRQVKLRDGRTESIYAGYEREEKKRKAERMKRESIRQAQQQQIDERKAEFLRNADRLGLQIDTGIDTQFGE